MQGSANRWARHHHAPLIDFPSGMNLQGIKRAIARGMLARCEDENSALSYKSSAGRVAISPPSFPMAIRAMTVAGLAPTGVLFGFDGRTHPARLWHKRLDRMACPRDPPIGQRRTPAWPRITNGNPRDQIDAKRHGPVLERW
jgi:hypothetical protein